LLDFGDLVYDGQLAGEEVLPAPSLAFSFPEAPAATKVLGGAAEEPAATKVGAFLSTPGGRSRRVGSASTPQGLMEDVVVLIHTSYHLSFAALQECLVLVRGQLLTPFSLPENVDLLV
jgi:hypothetical protein